MAVHVFALGDGAGLATLMAAAARRSRPSLSEMLGVAPLRSSGDGAEAFPSGEDREEAFRQLMRSLGLDLPGKTDAPSAETTDEAAGAPEGTSTIWKYPLNGDRRQKIVMPSVWRALSVGPDPSGQMCLWAMVDRSSPPAERTLHAIGTGQTVPDEVDPSDFLQTVVSGADVTHIFLT